MSIVFVWFVFGLISGLILPFTPMPILFRRQLRSQNRTGLAVTQLLLLFFACTFVFIHQLVGGWSVWLALPFVVICLFITGFAAAVEVLTPFATNEEVSGEFLGKFISGTVCYAILSVVGLLKNIPPAMVVGNTMNFLAEGVFYLVTSQAIFALIFWIVSRFKKIKVNKKNYRYVNND